MVRKTSAFVLYLYRHHFIRYLFVGSTTFIFDFALLFLLHGKASVDLAVATSIAYWVSIAYNFFLNRSWTFSARDKTDLRRHLSTYLILLGFNYLFTVVFVSLASHHINYLLAKAISVAISMSWTYFAYKNYIFTSKPPAEKELV
jgi:putative flippase GtrA